MESILGIPKYTSQGIPNFLSVRLAYMKNWNERLTYARELRGLNKSELAKGVFVSSPTVTDWESGEIKKLEADNLLKICDFLNISAKWLLFGKGEMDELVLTDDDYHAIKINRALELKQRRTWYQVGNSLAERDEGTNGKQ